MKTSFFGRKLSQMGVGAVMAGISAMASMPAQAEIQAVALEFKDLNSRGGFISLDKLNTISSPQFFSATYNLAVASGANTLNNGDTFSQHLTLLTNSSSLGDGAQNFALGGDYRFEVTLNGFVFNVLGAPITLEPGNLVFSTAESMFDVTFTSGTIALWDNAANIHITDLQFQSGGASGIQLVAGSFIGDITLNTLLGAANCTAASCDPYLLNSSGGSLAGAGLELFTITTTTGSARVTDGNAPAPDPFAGSNFATNTLVANFQDNGQSTNFSGSVVPEPESYALMLAGLCLIGYMARRRKQPASITIIITMPMRLSCWPELDKPVNKEPQVRADIATNSRSSGPI